LNSAHVAVACFVALLPFFLTVHCLLLIMLFFLIIRPPPSPTLFPSRRSSDLQSHQLRIRRRFPRRVLAQVEDRGPEQLLVEPRRSEEHTSELQSPDQLVCRLLLEKKNTQPSAPDRLVVQRPSKTTSARETPNT